MKGLFPPSTRMVDARLAEERELSETTQLRLENELSRDFVALRREMAMLYADLLGSGIECPYGEVPSLVKGLSAPLVVSIATYGPRAAYSTPMLQSLLRQTCKPDAAFLWIPRKDFPSGLADLPVEVLHSVKALDAKIVWVDEDLGPHNKYFHVMQLVPQATVVTLDDDTLYPEDHIQRLLEGEKRHPGCIVAARTHIMGFSADGSVADYLDWEQEQDRIIDSPSRVLVPTGVGGVLYPPGCLDGDVFDSEAIRELCLHADDMWLKIMSALAGTEVVDIGGGFELLHAEGTQESGLYHENKDAGGNDRQLSAIIEFLERKGRLSGLLEWMRREPDGE